MPSEKTAERRKRLMDLIEQVGMWAIPKSALCKEWGIGRPTLDKDIKIIMQGMPEDGLDDTRKELQNGYKAAISEMRKIIKNPESSKTEKSRASHALSNLLNHYTDHLEKWGRKKSEAQKLEITASVDAQVEWTEMVRRAKEALKNESGDVQ